MIGEPAPSFAARPIPARASPHKLPLPVHKRHPAGPNAVRNPSRAVSWNVRPEAVIVKIGITCGVRIASEDGGGFTCGGVQSIFTMENPFVEIVLRRIAGDF